MKHLKEIVNEGSTPEKQTINVVVGDVRKEVVNENETPIEETVNEIVEDKNNIFNKTIIKRLVEMGEQMTNDKITDTFKEHGLTDLQIQALRYVITHSDRDSIDGIKAFDGNRYRMMRCDTYGSITRAVDDERSKYVGAIGSMMRSQRRAKSPLFDYYKEKADRSRNFPARQSVYINVELLGGEEKLLNWARENG